MRSILNLEKRRENLKLGFFNDVHIYLQSDHKKTPQLISFLYEVQFQ
jgi:hypothetical protein